MKPSRLVLLLLVSLVTLIHLHAMSIRLRDFPTQSAVRDEGRAAQPQSIEGHQTAGVQGAHTAAAITDGSPLGTNSVISSSIYSSNIYSTNSSIYEPSKLGPSSGTALQKGVYIAVCLAVKDEHAAIREWIVYHHSIGVERFYVYDDNSQPPMERILSSYIKKGIVVYRLLNGPPESRQQLAIYSECLRQHGAGSTWLGTIDVDEFVIIRDGSPNLPAVLQRYEAFGGLVVNWRIFGSGHRKRPQQGVLQSYTRCTRADYRPNMHVKTFVNSAHVLGVGWSPHHFQYQEGYHAVNTKFTRVDGPFNHPPLSDVLVINHYILRSWEEFRRKIVSGNALFPGHGKTKDFWDRTEHSASRKCTYAVHLGAKIQKRLDKTAANRKRRKEEAAARSAMAG